MQESEEGYPIHQSQDRVEKGHNRPFDANDKPAPERKQTQPPSMSPVHQREQATTPGLPNYRFRNALIIGAIAGFFCVAQSINITL